MIDGCIHFLNKFFYKVASRESPNTQMVCVGDFENPKDSKNFEK